MEIGNGKLEIKFSFQFLMALIAVFFVTSCGFEPVYKANGGKNLRTELRTVKVEKIDFGRHGQELQTELEKIFNPRDIPAAPKYSLSIKLTSSKGGQAIQQNREVTRYDMSVTANFVLKEIGAKEIEKGTSRMVSSYDVVDSDFATYAAEEDALTRIMEEMARDISFKIAALLPKNGDNNQPAK